MRYYLWLAAGVLVILAACWFVFRLATLVGSAV